MTHQESFNPTILLSFEIIPTSLLQPSKIRKYNDTPLITTMNTTTVVEPIRSVTQTKELDRATGLAILKFVEEKERLSVNNTNTTSSSSNTTKTTQVKPRPSQLDRKKGAHKNTFYLGIEEEKERGKESTSVISSSTKKEGESYQWTNFIFDRKTLMGALNNFVNLGMDDEIRRINKSYLINHGVTVENLICDCKVDLRELRKCHIITNLDDLLDLGFKLSDMTIDRKIFNVTTAVTFFDVTYSRLRDYNDFDLGIFNIINSHFYAAELCTLGYHIDYMIVNNYIRKKDLLELNFELSDLVLLGFNAVHIKILGISQREAINTFEWNEDDYDNLMETYV